MTVGRNIFSQRGFTIIELLLAIMLMGVLVAVVYSTFVESVNAGKLAVHVSQRYSKSARVLDQMAREMECAFLSQSYRGENPEMITVFIGDTDTIMDEEADYVTFWTRDLDYFLTGEGDTNASEIGEVNYYLQANYDSGRVSLWKRVDYLPDREHTRGGYRIKLLDDVKSLTIRYFDGREWDDHWDSTEKKTLPRAVEVALSVWKERGKEKSYFTLHRLVILPLENEEKSAGKK